MQFLYLLEKIRNPVLDTFFSLITHLGEETVFLAMALVVFWCVNKREGYFLLITGLVGTVINQALKLICKIPRPWVKDPSFTIVESARAEATGYSFPSGHTQNASTTFGAIGIYAKRTPVRIISLVIILLVAFSRMYLGVHTPYDVGVSLVIGALLIFGLYPVFRDDRKFERCMPIIIAASVFLSIGLVLYVSLMSGEGVDPHNLASGRENAATLLGCTLAFAPVYYADKKLIRFDTKAKWYAQIIKLVLGIAIVLGIKAGLKAPLNLLFGNEYVGRAVRYFLIVIFAGIVWPLTFKLFANMKIKALDGKKSR
ncbi:MAG: phosphatase PAP2 family protein [Clostridia bacterium]|nr:phosphatase PAP2 family protein [Clostridia bacterium]